jgi:ATP-binding cassette subfamily C protein CydC
MGRVFKHIIGDVDILKFFFLRVLTVPVVALLIWAGGSIFFGFFSWKLIFILSALFILGGIIIPYIFRLLLSARRRDFNTTRQGYSESLYDYINGIADRQICGNTKQQLHTIEEHGRSLARERYYIGAWDSFAAVGSSLLANLATFAALLVMITLVSENMANGLVLASVIWVMWASFEAVQPVATMMEYMNQSSSALAGMEDAAARPREPLRRGKKTLPAKGDLTIENLSFSYEEDKPLFNDVSFTLKSGSKTALVGSSGTGKTTLLNLLIGFLPYEQGSEEELLKAGGSYARMYAIEHSFF